MEKVYAIRAQELSSDGRTTSWLMPKCFVDYDKCLKYLEQLIKDDKEYYMDGGWEEFDLDEMLTWTKTENSATVKWSFDDEYTTYTIETLELKEE